jgi:predicted nucleotidyltransferase
LEIDLTTAQRETLRRVFSRYADRLERVGIYGSRAQGTARPGSDVDIVLFGVDADTADRIRDELEESDLSIFAEVSAFDAIAHSGLRAEVERTVKTLFSRAELID